MGCALVLCSALVSFIYIVFVPDTDKDIESLPAFLLMVASCLLSEGYGRLLSLISLVLYAIPMGSARFLLVLVAFVNLVSSLLVR